MYVALLPLSKYKKAHSMRFLCVSRRDGMLALHGRVVVVAGLQLEMEREEAEKANKSVSEVCTRQQVKKASQTRNVCCRLRCRL